MALVKHYLSLVKFSHTIFALPFAFIGFALGVQQLSKLGTFPNVHHNLVQFLPASIPPSVVFYSIQFLLVCICMVTARSAAMAFNRYLDRHFDAKNPRTAIREIPAGLISAGNALRFTVANALLFVVATAFINKLCFLLSPVAVFVILFYSYTKRFTALCHLVLGVGLSLAPIGAYIAVTGRFDVLPILFSSTVFFWVAGFDIIFALQDEAFDRKEQLHSIPVALGTHKALLVSRVLHVLSGISVLAAGLYGDLGLLYWLGAVGFWGMLVYQHSIISPTNLSRVNIAFMTANGIASVVFSIFTIAAIVF